MQAERIDFSSQLRVDLLSDLFTFHRYMFEKRTGREFMLSRPEGNESHFKTVCRALEDAFYLRSTRLVINLPPGWAKAIDVNTPMLTKRGWVSAGEVIAGDELIGSKGWTKVLGVHPQGIVPAKKVTFSDHSSIVCNDSHKWGVYDRYTDSLKVKTTSEIHSDLIEKDGRKKWRIPLINEEYEGILAPSIEPYLYGCWLGDGHSYYAAITTMDKEIVDSFIEAGYTMSEHSHQRGKAKTYGIIKNGFSEYLRHTGQLGNKHFPTEAYMWGCDDRFELIQGLMDTDGTCDNRGEASFCNKNITIIEGMEYLIASIGGITKRIKCNGSFKLKIRVPKDTILFKLERKQKKMKYDNRGLPKRLISRIEKVDDREMVCFTVDAIDCLFAAGRHLILTHNSELCKSFIAWCFAHYPDCKFLYISHSFELATLHTASIRQTMSMPLYRKLFGIDIRRDSSAKDFFMTTANGAVAAFGSGSGITGHDAGLPGLPRFSGAVVIDDIHKPEEIHSETIRERVKRNYFETIERRLRAPNVPVLLIGQRLHEDDLIQHLLDGADGRTWDKVIIKALDDSGNARYPEVNPKSELLLMQKMQPYVFASQYQQNPMPAGGGLFQEAWFPLLDHSPEILATFVTGDSAETVKEYNDATVFSFWGIYHITFNGVPVDDMYGLHWIDCREMRVEPKDLEDNFLDFWSSCMRYPVKPKFAAIEKKSTGVTLLSVLKNIPGLRMIDVERAGTVNSKTNRFIEMQPFISGGQISLPSYGKHTKMCLDHMKKITANDVHKFDDIADTCYDAVKIALIDKFKISKQLGGFDYNKVAKNLMSGYNQADRLRTKAYGR